MREQVELQGIHDIVYLGDIRTPEYRVFLWDQTDTFSAIVLGTQTQTPREITNCVVSISINESDDSATTARLEIVPDQHETDKLTPYHFVARRIIQILYRDAAVGGDFMSLFIGPTLGQPGYRRNRESVEEVISINCMDRSFFYNNERKLNSPEYLTGADLGEIALDVATDATYGMGLQQEECEFGLFRHEVQHTHISLRDISFMEGLEFLGFIVDRYPGFNGAGHLAMRSTALDKPPARYYQDESLFLDLEWPSATVDLINMVKVIGVDSAVSKVVSPEQDLAEVKGTVGYFEQSYETRVFYTDDKQGRAQNIKISSCSMNGQLAAILSSNGAHLEDIDDFSCILVIETPYQSWVFIIFFSTYIAFFAIGGIFGGFFQEAMLIAAAVWLTLGLMIMQQMGTFAVTIAGEPYKLVYKEIVGEAFWSNLYDYELRPKTIENHLVHSQTLADSLARRELARETVKQCQRQINLPHDPFLEPTDIIEIPDGTRYYITSISRQFQRGNPSNMSVDALKIRDGKEYNGEDGFSLY